MKSDQSRHRAGSVAPVQTTFIDPYDPTDSRQGPPNLIAESRARLQSSGATALSQAELLSLLVGCGSELWYRYRSLAAIAQAPEQELTSLPGIGQATLCRIKAAMELGRRLIQEERRHRPQIKSPFPFGSGLLK